MRGLILSALMVIAASASARGSVVYSIQDYPQYQSGYTLTGSITTDGTIGTLNAANILAWVFQATNGTNTISFNSVQAAIDLASSSIKPLALNGVVATADGQIVVPRFEGDDADSSNFLELSGFDHEANKIRGLRWRTGRAIPRSQIPTDQNGDYYGWIASRSDPLNGFWFSGNVFQASLDMPSKTSDIVVAKATLISGGTVPEPASVSLLLSGGVGLALFGLARRGARNAS